MHLTLQTSVHLTLQTLVTRSLRSVHLTLQTLVTQTSIVALGQAILDRTKRLGPNQPTRVLQFGSTFVAAQQYFSSFGRERIRFGSI